MKVAVLKDFLVAVDDLGIKTRALVAGTVDEVADNLAPSLVDEGYVSLKVSDAALKDWNDPEFVTAGLTEIINANLSAKTQGAIAVEIPADWQTLHHKTRVALAKKLGAAADITADKADELIAAEVARRAGE